MKPDTELQQRVLELGTDTEKTSKEIAEELQKELNEDWVNTRYVERVLNDYELPEAEADGGQVVEQQDPQKPFVCAVCHEYEGYSPDDIYNHIANTKDAQHRDRKGESHNVLVKEGWDDIAQPHGGSQGTVYLKDFDFSDVEVDANYWPLDIAPDELGIRHLRVLKAIYQKPSADKKEIAWSLDLMESSLYNYYKTELGFDWEEREYYVDKAVDWLEEEPSIQVDWESIPVGSVRDHSQGEVEEGSDLQPRDAAVLAAFVTYPDKNQSEVAEELGVGRMTVSRSKVRVLGKDVSTSDVAEESRKILFDLAREHEGKIRSLIERWLSYKSTPVRDVPSRVWSIVESIESDVEIEDLSAAERSEEEMAEEGMEKAVEESEDGEEEVIREERAGAAYTGPERGVEVEGYQDITERPERPETSADGSQEEARTPYGFSFDHFCLVLEVLHQDDQPESRELAREMIGSLWTYTEE